MSEAFEKLSLGIARLKIERNPERIQLDRAGWLGLGEEYLDSLEPLMDAQRGDAVVAVGAVAAGELLTAEEVTATLDRFAELCAARQWVVTPLADVEETGAPPAPAPPAAAAAAAHHPGKECLVRRAMDADDFIEIKVATAGQVDSGKSTLLGVLTHGVVDDGDGKARACLLRNPHEQESGKTSSVTHMILGFDSKGAAVNRPTHQGKLNWPEICNEASKVVTFIDLAGHERYLKTTAFGFTGHRPDCAMVMVGANAGVQQITKEHIKLALGTHVPIMVVTTKIDMMAKASQVLERTRRHIRAILKSEGCRKIPFEVKSMADVIAAYEGFHTTALAPIFEVSNVTGEGIDLLKAFLNLLVPGRQRRDAEPARFQVDDDFTVPGIGTVVSGTVVTGQIRAGDTLVLGPSPTGEFVPTQVRSIERHRLPVPFVRSQEMATLAIRKVDRRDVRRGMVLVARELKPRAAWQFEAQLVILHHPTTIKRGYQTMVHCGCIRQTARIIDMPPDVRSLRSGDAAVCRFAFVRCPEYLEVGEPLVLREGRARGVGCVLTTDPDAPPYDKSKHRKSRPRRDGMSRRARRRARNDKRADDGGAATPAAAPAAAAAAAPAP